MLFLSLLVLLILTATTNATALDPDEILSDPVLEQRARNLSKKLRCVVCQSQSIEDSDADLAGDLRLLVRKKLLEGLSDQQILDYIETRYGQYVLMSPKVSNETVLLWLAPLILLLLGGFLTLGYFRKS